MSASTCGGQKRVPDPLELELKGDCELHALLLSDSCSPIKHLDSCLCALGKALGTAVGPICNSLNPLDSDSW